jgi:hypothetical protein
MYKIIGADGKEYGPVTADQLRQWISEGRANAQTRVLPEGATEWKPLGEIPEFGSAPKAPSAFVYTPPGAAGPNPATRVSGPAVGLIVTAVLNFLMEAGSLALNLLGTSILMSSSMPAEPAWIRVFSGTVGIASNILGLLVSILILVGGIKMMKLEAYGLAMTASILAMIPCISPCCLIGLPLGIWAAIVLSEPEVKGAFH